MNYWPPPLNALLAWSVLFRCKGTLCNYLGYVRTGCMIVGVSVQVGVACYLVCCLIGDCGVQQVFEDPALVKAKNSVAKGEWFERRDPLWLQRHACESLCGRERVRSCVVSGQWLAKCCIWAMRGQSLPSGQSSSSSLTPSFSAYPLKPCRSERGGGRTACAWKVSWVLLRSRIFHFSCARRLLGLDTRTPQE